MTAVMLVFGHLKGNDYDDGSLAATSPLVERLRKCMRCIQDPVFTADYHDPTKRTISNALTVTLIDGTELDEVIVEVPLGHRFRREEATPQIMRKYENHLKSHFSADRVDQLLVLGREGSVLEQMYVDTYMDLYVVPAVVGRVVH